VRVVAFYLVLIYQSYLIALFSLMDEKIIQNFGRHEKPQCCSQCREEGHNKGNIRCPINIKNAATAALAKDRQTKFLEDQNQENCNNFGKVRNFNLSRENFSSIEVYPVHSKDFCLTGCSSSNNSNSDAKFGPVIQDVTDNKILQLDPPHMDVDDEDLGKNLDPDISAMQEPDSDGEDFVVGLAQITGDRERMDVAIVAKGSEHIAAIAAEDEWMQDRQDLVTYQGRGALAAGRGSGRGVSLSGRGRGRGQHS
jgi:hypothetical protein